MGIVNRLGKPSEIDYMGSDGVRYTKKTGYFTNDDAPERLIRYVTRTRENESRDSELICWGVHGAAYADIATTIAQFMIVQQKCRDHTQRKMYHLSYSPDQYEKQLFNGDYRLVESIAKLQSSILFSIGYQVVYAVHKDDEKDIHIHFAVNSVNFYSGKMLCYSARFNNELNMLMTETSYRIIAKRRGKIYPLNHEYSVINPVQQ